MSPDLLETIQHSPLTPWVGGAILAFVSLALIKLIAKTAGKLLALALIVAIGALGWNWWGKPSERSFSDIRQEWFASVKSTDLSSKSIQALAEDTSRLLKEASAVSQSKGRELTQEALTKMADSLKEKMQDASARGEQEAERQFRRLHDEIVERLGQF